VQPVTLEAGAVDRGNGRADADPVQFGFLYGEHERQRAVAVQSVGFLQRDRTEHAETLQPLFRALQVVWVVFMPFDQACLPRDKAWSHAFRTLDLTGRRRRAPGSTVRRTFSSPVS
jgi:hypothetical protein